MLDELLAGCRIERSAVWCGQVPPKKVSGLRLTVSSGGILRRERFDVSIEARVDEDGMPYLYWGVYNAD